MTKTGLAALADCESKCCTLSAWNFNSCPILPPLLNGLLINHTITNLHPEADTQFVLVTGSNTCILAQVSMGLHTGAIWPQQSVDYSTPKESGRTHTLCACVRACVYFLNR